MTPESYVSQSACLLSVNHLHCFDDRKLCAACKKSCLTCCQDFLRQHLVVPFYTVRHKKLHPSYWYNNFAKLCHTVMIFGTWEYPIACLFDSLCKIVNWEPAYQICYCLLSSRQQRKMWNSCCNARTQTSSLQTYGLLTVLTLILWITGYVKYCSVYWKSVKNWTMMNWSGFWLKCCLASS